MFAVENVATHTFKDTVFIFEVEHWLLFLTFKSIWKLLYNIIVNTKKSINIIMQSQHNVWFHDV